MLVRNVPAMELAEAALERNRAVSLFSLLVDGSPCLAVNSIPLNRPTNIQWAYNRDPKVRELWAVMLVAAARRRTLRASLDDESKVEM